MGHRPGFRSPFMHFNPSFGIASQRKDVGDQAGKPGYMVAVDLYGLVEAGKLGEEDLIDLGTVQKQLE